MSAGHFLHGCSVPSCPCSSDEGEQIRRALGALIVDRLDEASLLDRLSFVQVEQGLIHVTWEDKHFWFDMKLVPAIGPGDAECEMGELEGFRWVT